MQRPDPSLWQHSWGLPLQSVTRSHSMTPFSITRPSSQFILRRRQTSRHFPVPDLFSNISDGINLHVIEEALGCTEKKHSHWGKKFQQLAVVRFAKKTACLLGK